MLSQCQLCFQSSLLRPSVQSSISLVACPALPNTYQSLVFNLCHHQAYLRAAAASHKRLLLQGKEMLPWWAPPSRTPHRLPTLWCPHPERPPRARPRPTLAPHPHLPAAPAAPHPPVDHLQADLVALPLARHPAHPPAVRTRHHHQAATAALHPRTAPRLAAPRATPPAPLAAEALQAATALPATRHPRAETGYQAGGPSGMLLW